MHCLRIGAQPIRYLATRTRAGLPVIALARPSQRRLLVAATVSRDRSIWEEERVEDGSMLEDEVAALFSHAMPKAEIGALKFLQTYPEYDGRGVKICIFDTGVDPGAAGLQITSDGKPKILDVIDCTGSGDVDTSRVTAADAEGCVVGASGRRLRINPEWANPTGEWRVGCKHVYDLISRTLVTRLKDERKKKWEESQRRAVAEAVAALARFDKCTPASKLGSDPEARRERGELEGRVNMLKELAKQYEDPGPLLDCVVWHDGSVWRAALDTSQLHPPGSGRGALADFKPLTNYALERQYGTFSELDSCNFVLNILDSGRTLSIVVDCGAHGTHVAGITAAHFPEDPGSNGIAPGAQIISCKIGDTRLGSMETGTGVVRGLIAARQHGAHLINMSYGEPTTTPNVGRFISLATELVRNHNVIFVASAGNAGPALSTVGAPGGTSSALFGVGAFVSPQLATAGHSVLEAPPPQGLQYNWSSRGPTPDGHVGVAFSAPGGAIAPVPQWTQQRRQLMNGTSMSSPNACGGIALLLSGLLTRGSVISPHRLRRALENTALPLGGDAPDAVLTYGRGLIQIGAAWDYLLHDSEAAQQTPPSPPEVSTPPFPWPSPSPPSSSPPSASSASSASSAVSASGVCPGPWYELEAVCAEGRGPKGRGIYMREPHETTKAQSYRITVTPKLREGAANSSRLDVEDRLALEATVPWVTCPPALMVHSGGRSFEVLVDPSRLPPGLHYGEVLALEVEARERGPLFRLPITVIKPLQVPGAVTSTGGPPAAVCLAPLPAHGIKSAGAGVGAVAAVSGNVEVNGGGCNGVATVSLGPMSFTPGTEYRRFVAVPPGATWAELTLRAAAYDTPKLFLIRGTQLRPESSYRQHELRTQVTLSGGSEYLTSLGVRGGATLELTLAQFWSSQGASQLQEVELTFYGVELCAEGGSGSRPGTDLALEGAEVAKKVLVSAPTWSRSTRIKPEAKLTCLHIPLRPVETSLEPLTEDRDALTDGRVIYRLLLTYKTSLSEAGKYKPCLPLINEQVYDSPLESQLLLVHDGSTRQLLSVQDSNPESVSLKKGEVLLRLALRHDNQELLDKMRGLPLVLKRNLDNGGGVTVPVYGSRRDAILAAGGSASPAGEMLLRAGDGVPLWLGPVPEDKLPKDAVPGRLLTGRLTLGQLKRGGGTAPHEFTVSYLVPPAASTSGNGNGNGAKDDKAADKAPAEKLNEAIRDAKIKVMKELKLSEPDQAELYDKLFSELRASYPGHLPLLLEHLKKMDGQEVSVRSSRSGIAAVIEAAKLVVAAVDGGALAAFLGVKAAEDTPEHRKLKAEMEERKSALVEALSRQATALLEAEELQEKEKEKKEGEAAAAEAADVGEGQPAEPTDGAEAEEATPGVASGAAAAVAPAPVAAAASSEKDAVAEVMQELRKWVDTASEPAHLLLHAKVEARAKRYASALKALDKLMGSDDKAVASAAARRDVSNLKRKLYDSLGWTHWASLEKDLQATRFPEELALI
ncbi:hypothetical protein PLESTB_000062200 [Pleodorina starrii]|uniref:Tripeptidyl-peptidase 2 n=1 Tax=Pleodorina starrii TaxID=330485 RepID=A0A9W6B9I6_9CHLO|nr:hypothetical protein PLESTM_001611100 [Pleodorina starrii]GLC48129.1 hypothetical protein PLESTB_000062200 [Pleodorina starrii]